MTVERAKEEVAELQNFIHLAENYKASTVEQFIIKEYAFLGSIAKVAAVLNQRGYRINNQLITQEQVSEIIRGKATDELHKIIKTGYLRKTLHQRRKVKQDNRFYLW